MTLNLFLWLFTLITFVSYVTYIVVKYGMQKSISASWNNLENPVKKSLYSWAMACVALPMAIISDNAMGIWAGFFLAITFAAPTGGSRLNHFLHCLGANVGMLLGTLQLILVFGGIFNWILVGLCYITVVTMLAIASKSKITESGNASRFPTSTSWIEIAVFITVMIGLFFEKVV
ncbi:MAG: hypothetical protein KA807_16355 [Prolixibacteraceae bacterium]|nr:hypothetical protein [Prolixibacteraceae bacterium]